MSKMENNEIKEGDIVSFKYRGGRYVKGEVLRVGSIGFMLTLHTDYYGKNEDWYAGEKKTFLRSQVKDLKIHTSPS